MTDVEKLTFGELERDRIIRADWGLWHPSLCDQRDQLGSDANPETTLCMRLFLRSDTKQEKAERKGWPNKLLRFKTLKCLKVNGCTPELFESICMLPALRRLSIVRGRVPSLHGLKGIPDLTHFYYCGSPRLASLEGLNELKSLVGLSLVGNFESVRTLDPIANVSELQSLCLCANDFCQNRYESLTPIGALRKLRDLAVLSTKVDRDGLFPIGKLRGLQYLTLAEDQLRFWSIAEFRHLHENLPNLKGNLIRLAANDVDFQREHKIR